MPKLYCSWEGGCEEIVGTEYPATRYDPSEVSLYNEDHIDDEGRGLCDTHYEKYQQAKADLEEQEREEQNGKSEADEGNA